MPDYNIFQHFLFGRLRKDVFLRRPFFFKTQDNLWKTFVNHAVTIQLQTTRYARVVVLLNSYSMLYIHYLYYCFCIIISDDSSFKTFLI
ncbi:MAG: hypothetical protein DSY58_05680 [Desulfobulbus sp.]|nr:MAG: hypothetical protein DSY58_05680 [Desulfobulbus sp.]